VRDHYLSSDTATSENKGEIANLSSAALEKMVVKNANEVLAVARENLRASIGVTCFAEKNDNLLMWSHYADQHKGFCLEFHTDQEPFDGIVRVDYVETMPEISMTKFVIDRAAGIVNKLLFTKSKDWKYEKEWRRIYLKAKDSLRPYHPSALKAVYFGSKIEDRAVHIICQTVSGLNSETEFWRGSHLPAEFKLKFDQFEFTPDVDIPRESP
jgi:hypothetical protein